MIVAEDQGVEMGGGPPIKTNRPKIASTAWSWSTVDYLATPHDVPPAPTCRRVDEGALEPIADQRLTNLLSWMCVLFKSQLHGREPCSRSPCKALQKRYFLEEEA